MTYTPPTSLDPAWAPRGTGGTPFSVARMNGLRDGVRELYTTKADVLPTLYDDVTGKADGALAFTDSSHAWSATGSAVPVIRNGAITFPSGVTAANASYARAQLPAPCVRVGGRFRFEASDNFRGNATVGAFSTTAIPSPTPFHLSLTPTYAELAVYDTAFTPLVPEGYLTSQVPIALATDGTEYVVDVEVDRVAARAWVSLPDGRVLTYRHPLIGSIAAAFPFWETYTQTNGEAISGWREVWADTAVTSVRAPHASHREVAAAAGHRPGAGTIYARHAAASRPGSTWWDTTRGALSVSDGERWRDTAGALVGNLVPAATALMRGDTSTVWSIAGSATGSRSRTAPSGRASSLRLLSTGTSGARTDMLQNVQGIVAGTSYTAIVGKLMSPSASPGNCYAQISWYDAGGAYLSGTAGGTTTPGVSGAWAPTAAVTATAPTNAVQAAVNVVWLPAAAGLELYLTEYALARALAITGYVET